MRESWLVTGALGCLGAWTCTLLAREEARVTGLDLGTDDARLRLIAVESERERITLVHGDITDSETLARVLDEHEITHIVHLAALQVPFCKADPALGARVNVQGTVNVFEAAKGQIATTLAYASSAAVYDTAGNIAPQTLYGVYKLANEGTARVYWADDRVASAGLRPFCVYGPGRDQGLTAAPTLAIAAAVRGEPHTIPFGGRTQLHFAPDVARAFVAAARSTPEEARVYNLGGPAVAIADFVALVGRELPGAAIGHDDRPLPFPEMLPAPHFDLEQTPLAEGVGQTIQTFRRTAVPS